jgi:flagellar protein FliO/FliZ
MPKASLHSWVAATVAAVVLLLLASTPAHAAAGESTPVDLSGAGGQGSHIGGSGGGSLVRTIVGLAIVIGVIYGVAWVLRQVKASRQPQATGAGLASLASIPLGPNRSVHLVRAGRDLVLLGVAEHGVVPIRAYSEDEAHAAGLIDEDGLLVLPAEQAAPRRAARPALRLPQLRLPQPARPRAALPAAGAGGREPGRALDALRAWTVRS